MPHEARDRAQRVLGNIAHGRDPDHGLVGTQLGVTLGELVEGRYGHWAQAHYASGNDTLTRVKRCFGHWFQVPLIDISPAMIEAWVAQRLNDGISGATVNRDLCVLGAIFTRAVTWELAHKNPVRAVRKCPVDKNPVTRFLSMTEQKRLMQALAARDDHKRQKRTKANQWRKERRYPLMPTIGKYCDHLTPMVLVSIYTGCRRGELLSLTWNQVDLERKLLTLPGSRTKNGQTRIVNLNSAAVATLTQWRKDSNSLFVFAGPEGRPLSYLKTAWSRVLKEAEIEAFRWHDLRHTFASNLVMAGVDLNTVRELLGHSDITMTLRYAHDWYVLTAYLPVNLILSRCGSFPLPKSCVANPFGIAAKSYVYRTPVDEHDEEVQ